MIYKADNSIIVYEFWIYCINNGYILNIDDAYPVICDAKDQNNIIDDCKTKEEYFDQLLDKFVHEESCV